MTMPTGDAQTSPPTHDGSAPPLPHAAPAPAAEAGTTEAGWMQLVNDMLTRAEAAEAERDRLAEQNAALLREAQVWAGEARAQRATVHESYQAATGATGEPGDWNGAEPVRALAAERDRLSAELAALNDAKARFDAARNAALDRAERAEAEVAALRGALPDPELLDLAARIVESDAFDGFISKATALYAAGDRIRALAAAAPTPQAAGTGTGVDDDTRRLAWLATELAYDWTIGEIDIAELACAYASDAGREDEDPIADDVIAALRRAIDTMMSLDRPQEADHAAQ